MGDSDAEQLDHSPMEGGGKVFFPHEFWMHHKLKKKMNLDASYGRHTNTVGNDVIQSHPSIIPIVSSKPFAGFDLFASAIDRIVDDAENCRNK